MALQTHNSNGAPMIDFHSQETVDFSIELDRKPKGRQRANSKVYGSSSPSPSSSPTFKNISSGNGSNGPKTVENQEPVAKKSSKLYTLLPKKESFIYILVLTSLNGTFGRKTLEIPQYPEVLKLGRPNSSQKAPDAHNGYFDSRVISREHAQLSVKEGKVYINDLNSANGTFLNGVKILKEQELNEGDIVELGINIDNDNNKHHHHRKISCQVSGFLTFPLNSPTDRSKIFDEIANKDDNDTMETSKELSAFDAAMFGDITEDLDDVALGIHHDFLTGIFVNNNIGTNANLVRSIRELMSQVHSERVNNLKLASIEKFLETFRSQLSKDEDVLKYQKYKSSTEKYRKKLEELTVENSKLMRTCKEKELIESELQEVVKNVTEELTEMKNALQAEVETNLRLTERVEDLSALIMEKDRKLSDLEQEYSLMNLQHKSDKKSLQSELDEKTKIIRNLESEKQISMEQESKKEIITDLLKLSYIVVGVVLAGVSVLKLF